MPQDNHKRPTKSMKSCPLPFVSLYSALVSPTVRVHFRSTVLRLVAVVEEMEKVHNLSIIRTSLASELNRIGSNALPSRPNGQQIELRTERLFPLFICCKLKPTTGPSAVQGIFQRASQTKSSVSINEISHHKLPASQCDGQGAGSAGCAPASGTLLVVVNNACALTQAAKKRSKKGGQR